MPAYRVSYAERAPMDRHSSRPHFGAPATESYSEAEWEEEVEAKDPVAALEAFFRDHVRDRSEVKWVDENGESRPVEGIAD